ncbi:MAG: hypothetical protein AB1894_20600 [Chloroflexota bacterium]
MSEYVYKNRLAIILVALGLLLLLPGLFYTPTNARGTPVTLSVYLRFLSNHPEVWHQNQLGVIRSFAQVLFFSGLPGWLCIGVGGGSLLIAFARYEPPNYKVTHMKTPVEVKPWQPTAAEPPPTAERSASAQEPPAQVNLWSPPSYGQVAEPTRRPTQRDWAVGQEADLESKRPAPLYDEPVIHQPPPGARRPAYPTYSGISPEELAGFVSADGKTQSVRRRTRQAKLCPRCGTRLRRTHRNWWMRLWRKGQHRYHCTNRDCGWQGFLMSSAAPARSEDAASTQLEDSLPAPGEDQHTLAGVDLSPERPCPRCGKRLHRVRRTRLMRIFYKGQRLYRCSDPDCAWQGLLPVPTLSDMSPRH